MPGETRLGFIGLSVGGGSSGDGSWASKSHLPYLKSDRNGNKYKITAIQNSSKTSAENAAKKFELGEVACYSRPEDIAKDPNVDVVAVSVNVPGHYDTVMPALQAGKDIFVEWRLARNLKDAEEITALAREKNVRTLVGLQARQNPSVLAVKKMVDTGELGDILGTTMHAYGLIFGATVSKDLAYGYPVEAGANLLTIPFGHAADALCFVLGELEYVAATLANRRPKFGVTDASGEIVEEGTKTAHDYVAVTGVLQKTSGVVSIIFEGGQNPSGGPGFFWQINGTKGTVVLESGFGHLQMFQPTVRFAKAGQDTKDLFAKGEERSENLDVKWVGNDFSYAVGEAWDAFAGKGDGNVTTFQDALLRHKMIDAIYRSNETGKREKYI